MSQLVIAERLPKGLTLEYLRQLASVPTWWVVVAHFDFTLAKGAYSGLDQSFDTKTASVLFNPAFDYSPRSFARTLMHELFELSLCEIWRSTLRALEGLSDVGMRLRSEKQIRRARDEYIDQRLNEMPFWTYYDLPTPKAVERFL